MAKQDNSTLNTSISINSHNIGTRQGSGAYKVAPGINRAPDVSIRGLLYKIMDISSKAITKFPGRQSTNNNNTLYSKENQKNINNNNNILYSIYRVLINVFSYLQNQSNKQQRELSKFSTDLTKKIDALSTSIKQNNTTSIKKSNTSLLTQTDIETFVKNINGLQILSDIKTGISNINNKIKETSTNTTTTQNSVNTNNIQLDTDKLVKDITTVLNTTLNKNNDNSILKDILNAVDELKQQKTTAPNPVQQTTEKNNIIVDVQANNNSQLYSLLSKLNTNIENYLKNTNTTTNTTTTNNTNNNTSTINNVINNNSNDISALYSSLVKYITSALENKVNSQTYTNSIIEKITEKHTENNIVYSNLTKTEQEKNTNSIEVNKFFEEFKKYMEEFNKQNTETIFSTIANTTNSSNLSTSISSPLQTQQKIIVVKSTNTNYDVVKNKYDQLTIPSETKDNVNTSSANIYKLSDSTSTLLNTNNINTEQPIGVTLGQNSLYSLPNEQRISNTLFSLTAQRSYMNSKNANGMDFIKNTSAPRITEIMFLTEINKNVSLIKDKLLNYFDFIQIEKENEILFDKESEQSSKSNILTESDILKLLSSNKGNSNALTEKDLKKLLKSKEVKELFEQLSLGGPGDTAGGLSPETLSTLLMRWRIWY